MSKTVIFQTIQFNISTQFSSIWPIDKTLSGATTPGQSGYGSDDNEAILRIPQITIRLFSVVSKTLVGETLPLFRVAVSVFYSPSQRGNISGDITSLTVELKVTATRQYSTPQISRTGPLLFEAV